jgi:hypothetical protein
MVGASELRAKSGIFRSSETTSASLGHMFVVRHPHIALQWIAWISVSWTQKPKNSIRRSARPVFSLVRTCEASPEVCERSALSLPSLQTFQSSHA